MGPVLALAIAITLAVLSGVLPAQIREVEDLRLGDPAKTSIPDWAQSTAYATNQVVLESGTIYRRTVSGTSGLVFDQNSWVKAAVPVARQLTVQATAGETSVVQGTQDLSIDRSFTVGLADDVVLPGSLTIPELSADPADPAEGATVIWQSDGTGFGDDGDIILKITAGAVTKTHTLVDFSVIADEEP
jgi:hypothetical protein